MNMTFDELKDKALSLPYAPGVYIMRDKHDKVIYVGKSRALKNRVSGYFQESGQNSLKTDTMTAHIFDFIEHKRENNRHWEFKNKSVEVNKQCVFQYR